MPEISLIANLARSAIRHPLYMGNMIEKKVRLLRRYRWIAAHSDADRSVPPPLACKLVLTYRCNLSCPRCFQWGSGGWCTRDDAPGTAEELDWTCVQRLFARIGAGRPNFILTGGEPLLYSRFRDLAAMLTRYRCHTTICTNGTLLNRYTDVAAANPFLSFLVSLDGLEQENDGIRGDGVYARVVENIERLKKLPRPPYIGIQFTIHTGNVGVMAPFCKEMARLGVDWVLLNSFWFLTPTEARDYARFMEERFSVRPVHHKGFLYAYPVDRDVFLVQYRKIREAGLPVQISSYYSRPEDIHAYLDAPDRLVGERRCYKQWVRVDVTPEGDVTPCVQWPDLVFGNLRDDDILDIWNSQAYGEFRSVVRRENLPICAKCNNIYLYDAKRRHL